MGLVDCPRKCFHFFQIITFLSALDRVCETSYVATRYYAPSVHSNSFESDEQLRRPLRQQISANDFDSTIPNREYADFGKVPCLFRIKVPHTKPGDTVKIAGGSDSLGNWKTDRAVTLTTSEHDFPW